MATVTYIPEHTQSQTAMRRVIDYVVQDKKTLYEQDERKYKLISGKDCCPDIAFQEFMATKKQYDKAVGMFFYQYVQSFSPDEDITTEQVHAVGLELAEYFKGHEVLVATHVDAKHIHTHFIINSVSFETGLKLQEGPDSLFKLRKMSDEKCLSHNLSVLPPYSHGISDVKGLNAREYRAAEKGDSWKFRLMGAIDQSMAASRTKIEFIDNMAVHGYQTNWTANRKHITYTTVDGKKCRDNKLHEEKYLKERMEGYFLELSTIERQEQAREDARNCRSGRGVVEALPPDCLRDTARTMGSDNNAAFGTAQNDYRNAGIHELLADAGLLERHARPLASKYETRPPERDNGVPGQPKNRDGQNEVGNGRADGILGERYSRKNAGYRPKPERKPKGAVLVSEQPAAEMGRSRRGYYDSMLGGLESPEPDLNDDLQEKKNSQKKESVRQFLHEHPKQRGKRNVRQHDRDEWDMEM